MLRVGLTGGLGSGKSFVGQTLEQLGCFVIRADELGHAALLPDGEAYRGVIEEFGPSILNPDSTIDRRCLASLVFNDPDRLAKLNALVHPAVRTHAEQKMKDFARDHPAGIAVYEAAILIETGSYREFSKILVAVCRPEQQVERAMARDGITRQEVLARLSRQMPLEEIVKYADYVIDTSGAKVETVKQVRSVYQILADIAKTSG